MSTTSTAALGWLATTAVVSEGCRTRDVAVAIRQDGRTPTRSMGFVEAPKFFIAPDSPLTEAEREWDELFAKLRDALPWELIRDIDSTVNSLRVESYDHGHAVGAGQLYDTVPEDERDGLERERKAWLFDTTQAIEASRWADEAYGAGVRERHPDLARQHDELIRELEDSVELLSVELPKAR